MVNARHILVGWGKKWGILPTSEAEAKLSATRLQICSTCPEAKVSKVLTFVTPEEAEEVERIYCTRCSCPCIAKTLVVGESCPINRWP